MFWGYHSILAEEKQSQKKKGLWKDFPGKWAKFIFPL